MQKIITKKLINNSVFSTLAVQRLVRYIFKQNKKLKLEMLKCISDGNFKKLKNLIADEKIRMSLKIMLSGTSGTSKNNDILCCLMNVETFLQNNQYAKASNLLLDINYKKMKAPEKGIWRMQMARIAMFEGDFLSASEDAAKALKILQKYDMLFEEAQTYFVLGTLYRVSGIYDSADFMLRSALQLSLFIGATKMEIEILGTFGMLMNVQKRFAEAANYFIKAEKKAVNAKYSELEYFVRCQRAMSALVQKDYKNAEKIILPILKEGRFDNVTAMASDIMARIKFAEQKYTSTIQYAEKASEIYYSKNNFAAAFECCYLAAETFFNKGALNKAEKTLRKLIEQEKHHKSCFHIANAFTLLGLVLLQKNEISRAKSIFNLALKQELYNDRRVGAAIDYANLANVERICGNISEAQKNLKTAIDYAKDTDEVLYNKLMDALN